MMLLALNKVVEAVAMNSMYIPNWLVVKLCVYIIVQHRLHLKKKQKHYLLIFTRLYSNTNLQAKSHQAGSDANKLKATGQMSEKWGKNNMV